MGKRFIFEKTVYLGDTNAEGNVYFARYFDWQGYAREEFYKHIQPDFLTSGVKLITVEATTMYKIEAKLYDEISIVIQIGKIKATNIEMTFTYLNRHTKETIAIGKEIIAYANEKGKLLRIPIQIKEKLNEYLV